MTTKAARGTKRVCSSCGAKFYDLNNTPIICPMCEAEFKLAKTAESKGEAEKEKKKAEAAAAAAAEPPKAKDPATGDDETDPDLAVVEDEDLADIEDIDVSDDDESDDEDNDTFLPDDDDDSSDDVNDLIGDNIPIKDDES